MLGRKSLLWFLIIGIGFTGCCLKVDCFQEGAHITLRVFNNGERLIKADTATNFSILSTSFSPIVDSERSAMVNGNEGTLSFFITPGNDLQVEINDTLVGVFSVTTVRKSTKECCDEFEPSSVTKDGSIICNGTDCNAVLEIQL